jgi:serine/threonine protein kinase
VQTTYKRIKENDYAFPEGVEIPSCAKKLIRRILTSIPEQRPTLQEILEDEFFVNSYIPRSLPLSALSSAPTFSSSRMAQESSSRHPLADTTNTHTLAATGGKERKVEDVIAEAKAQIAMAAKPLPTLFSQLAVRPAHVITSPAEDIADVFHDMKKTKETSPEESAKENCENDVMADSMGTRKRLRSPFRNTGLTEKSPVKQRARRSNLSAFPSPLSC